VEAPPVEKIIEKIVTKEIEEPSNEYKTCKICMDREYAVMIPCGHICMCLECAMSQDKCPICRLGYDQDKDIKRIFLVWFLYNLFLFSRKLIRFLKEYSISLQ